MARSARAARLPPCVRPCPIRLPPVWPRRAAVAAAVAPERKRQLLWPSSRHGDITLSKDVGGRVLPSRAAPRTRRPPPGHRLPFDASEQKEPISFQARVTSGYVPRVTCVRGKIGPCCTGATPLAFPWPAHFQGAARCALAARCPQAPAPTRPPPSKNSPAPRRPTPSTCVRWTRGCTGLPAVYTATARPGSIYFSCLCVCVFCGGKRAVCAEGAKGGVNQSRRPHPARAVCSPQPPPC